jgi:SAM-dependent methyltransferase
MRRTAITLAEAQSFDRVAGAYDRLGDLNPNELVGSWLEGLLPSAGGRALDIGCGTGRHAVLLAGRHWPLCPGYRFDILGGPRGIGLVWDAPRGIAAGKPSTGNGDAIG